VKPVVLRQEGVLSDGGARQAGRQVGPVIHTARDGGVQLRANGETLNLRYEPGETEISGLAGTNPPMVRISEFLLLEPEPLALAFIQRHEVVDVEYVVERTDFGGDSDRSIVAHGCRLLDLSLVESTGGTRVRYLLRAERLTGDLFAFMRAQAR